MIRQPSGPQRWIEPRPGRLVGVVTLLCGLTMASAAPGLVRGAADGPPLASVPAGAGAGAVPGSSTSPVLLVPAALEQLPGGSAPVPPGSTPAAFSDAPPDGERVRVAIAFAMAQLGLPYVWGGNGPAAGHAGFDCSGLTTAAFAAAGIRLPRTAHTQYYAGPHVPAGADLLPGDLVFYGVPSRVHHVGLYLGEGRMVAAPTFGKPVRVSFFRWPGDDYLGATRPAAAPGSLRGGYLPSVPAPGPGTPAPAPVVSEVFAAPEAPLTPALAGAVPVAGPEAAPLPPGSVTEGAVDTPPVTSVPPFPAPTPSPSPTPTPTPTPSPTPASASTAALTPSPTPSPTPGSR